MDGLEGAIVGDITHSRVARSNIQGLTKLGSKVYLQARRPAAAGGGKAGRCYGL